MSSQPSAEWAIDGGMVRALIAAQRPSHADAPISFLSEGWDNALYRVGDTAIARLPRRAVALELVRNEHRWVPRLPRLPLPIPRPIHAGEPSDEFPYPWSLVPYFPGEVWLQSPPSDPALAAGALAHFFRALHVDAPPDAPRNAFRGVPIAARAERVESALHELGTRVDSARLREVWQRALDAPSANASVWIHGDPHPGNLLVDQGELSAVIDFGDISCGDPASRPRRRVDALRCQGARTFLWGTRLRPGHPGACAWVGTCTRPRVRPP